MHAISTAFKKRAHEQKLSKLGRNLLKRSVTLKAGNDRYKRQPLGTATATLDPVLPSHSRQPSKTLNVLKP